MTRARAPHMISLLREVSQGVLLLALAGSSLGGILTAVLLATRMLGR
ncbi:hypothetical protein BH18ACT15_BH18ACT15_02270 [soil metagenome]